MAVIATLLQGSSGGISNCLRNMGRWGESSAAMFGARQSLGFKAKPQLMWFRIFSPLPWLWSI
jgi:hypothetical protein